MGFQNEKRAANTLRGRPAYFIPQDALVDCCIPCFWSRFRVFKAEVENGNAEENAPINKNTDPGKDETKTQ